MESGIEIAMMSVLRQLPRKSRIIQRGERGGDEAFAEHSGDGGLDEDGLIEELGNLQPLGCGCTRGCGKHVVLDLIDNSRGWRLSLSS